MGSLQIQRGFGGVLMGYLSPGQVVLDVGIITLRVQGPK